MMHYRKDSTVIKGIELASICSTSGMPQHLQIPGLPDFSSWEKELGAIWDIQDEVLRLAHECDRLRLMLEAEKTQELVYRYEEAVLAYRKLDRELSEMCGGSIPDMVEYTEDGAEITLPWALHSHAQIYGDGVDLFLGNGTLHVPYSEISSSREALRWITESLLNEDRLDRKHAWIIAHIAEEIEDHNEQDTL